MFRQRRAVAYASSSAAAHAKRGGIIGNTVTHVGDRIAGAAGELLAHGLDHLSVPRHHLQRLGDVLGRARLQLLELRLELIEQPAAGIVALIS